MKIEIYTLSKKMMKNNIYKIMQLQRFAQDKPWTKAEFMNDLNRKWELSLIAFAYDKIVGYVIASEVVRNHIYIHRLSTYPRGHGIAIELLNNLGHDMICQVGLDMPEVIQFYIDVGFEIKSYVMERR